MTKQNPISGRYLVTSVPFKELAVIYGAKYDHLRDAIEHSETVTYRMVVYDLRRNVVIHRNWSDSDNHKCAG